MAGVSWTARHFPVRVGRDSENELRIEDQGVWNRHFAISFDPVEGFTLEAGSDALVNVNHQPVRTHHLRPGDTIEIGSARLRFWIAEPSRRSLRWREHTFWILLAVIIVVEIWILLRLLA